MEVKRYKQTKEKLRRRRERLLHKVRLLASKTQPGQVFDAALKVGFPRGALAVRGTRPQTSTSLALCLQADLVDSETDSDADSEDAISEPAPTAAPVPVPPIESPIIVVPSDPDPVAEEPPVAVDADEVARKIKEQFRSSMARVMVQHLNSYRHSDAKAGRITCTADFKHLARKVGHTFCNLWSYSRVAVYAVLYP